MSSTMVQVRNVPPEFHRRLKARAAMEGMSMSDYVLREVGKALDRLHARRVLARLQAQPVRKLKRSAASIVRAERDRR
jgi:plasmid stability protein